MVLKELNEMFRRVRPIIPFVGYPVWDGGHYKPFFIIGVGRSGTTLLRRMLLAHPSIHIPPGAHILKRCIQVYRRHSNMRWRDLVFLIVAQYANSRDFEEVRFAPLARELVAAPIEKRSLSFTIDQLYRYHAKQYKPSAQIWGDKTPGSTKSLPGIARVFPEARFIHLVRDGYDVVCSFLTVGLSENLEAAAKKWIVNTRRAEKFRKSHSNPFITVRYEELVSDPEKIIRSIADFIGVSFVDGMVASEKVAETMVEYRGNPLAGSLFEPVTTDNIGKGRRNLSRGESDRLEKLIGKDLEYWGYPRA